MAAELSQRCTASRELFKSLNFLVKNPEKRKRSACQPGLGDGLPIALPKAPVWPPEKSDRILDMPPMQPVTIRLPSSWIRTLGGVLFFLVPAQVALAQSAALPSGGPGAGRTCDDFDGRRPDAHRSAQRPRRDRLAELLGRSWRVGHIRHAGNGVRHAEPRLGPRDQRDRWHGRGR